MEKPVLKNVMNEKLKDSRNIIQMLSTLEYGAKNNWDFLTPHTDKQLLDFYHVTEYLAKSAYAVHPKDKSARKQWLSKHCSQLKHEENAAQVILEELENLPTPSSKDIALNSHINLF